MMGFATFAGDLRTAMLSDALNWATDFRTVIAVVCGLLVFGLAMKILRAFI